MPWARYVTRTGERRKSCSTQLGKSTTIFDHNYFLSTLRFTRDISVLAARLPGSRCRMMSCSRRLAAESPAPASLSAFLRSNGMSLALNPAYSATGFASAGLGGLARHTPRHGWLPEAGFSALRNNIGHKWTRQLRHQFSSWIGDCQPSRNSLGCRHMASFRRYLSRQSEVLPNCTVASRNWHHAPEMFLGSSLRRSETVQEEISRAPQHFLSHRGMG